MTELQHVAEEAMRRLHVPGAAIGILDSGSEEVETFGVTNLEHPLPVDRDTIFRVFSLTKTVVAATAMCLVRRGLLDLDAPVRTYLPGLRLSDENVAHRVTTRDLLSHRVGWADTPSGDPGAPLAASTDMVSTLPQLRPFGAWSYCNSGVMLAGRVLEVASGVSFEKVVRESVLDPLEMTRSSFELGEMITHRVAVGHVRTGSTADGEGEPTSSIPTVVRPWTDIRWMRPSTGFGTTLSDMLRYLRFQLNEEIPGVRRPLDEGAVRSMHVPVTEDGQVALAWLTRTIEGVPTVSLGGSGLGFGVYALMAPEKRFAVCVLTNAPGHQFDREIVAWALEHHLGISERRPLVNLDRATAAEYAGRYISEHQVVRVEAHTEGIIMHVTRTGPGVGGAAGRPDPVDALRLAYEAPDRVVVTEGSRVGLRGEFLRNSAGHVTMLRIPTLLHLKESEDGHRP